MPRSIRVATGSAFHSGPIGYRAQVDESGTVRVWDSVARHWTLCHSLTARQIGYIRSHAA